MTRAHRHGGSSCKRLSMSKYRSLGNGGDIQGTAVVALQPDEMHAVVTAGATTNEGEDAEAPSPATVVVAPSEGMAEDMAVTLLMRV